MYFQTKMEWSLFSILLPDIGRPVLHLNQDIDGMRLVNQVDILAGMNDPSAV